ncbi:MAG: hypothetical protein V1869_00390 [Candidatus Omnitrophota bacterium]
MGFSGSRIIKFAVMLVFVFCMLFANFFAVRMMLRSGVDAYFYDKLLVAYNIGGVKGLETELGKITFTDRLPRELTLAKDLSARLKLLADPGIFLKDKVAESKKAVYFIRSLRSIAIVLMIIIFGWQMFVNLSGRLKSRNQP